MKIYLDTSAMAKRYLDEPGSGTVSDRYRNAWDGKDILFLSIWNMGEFIDILTRKGRTGELNPAESSEIMKDFQGEMIGLRRKRAVVVVPMTNALIERSWETAIREKIYMPDALQIVTALDRHCDILFSGDSSLIQHSSKVIPSEYVG